MATPPPGFPIPAFTLKDVSSFFERMPRFFDGGYIDGKKYDARRYFTFPRRLRSPDVEQMRDDIQRAETAYRPEPITFIITMRGTRYEPPGLPALPIRRR